jgi:Aspartyl protease
MATLDARLAPRVPALLLAALTGCASVAPPVGPSYGVSRPGTPPSEDARGALERVAVVSARFAPELPPEPPGIDRGKLARERAAARAGEGAKHGVAAGAQAGVRMCFHPITFIFCPFLIPAGTFVGLVGGVVGGAASGAVSGATERPSWADQVTAALRRAASDIDVQAMLRDRLRDEARAASGRAVDVLPGLGPVEPTRRGVYGALRGPAAVVETAVTELRASPHAAAAGLVTVEMTVVARLIRLPDGAVLHEDRSEHQVTGEAPVGAELARLCDEAAREIAETLFLRTNADGPAVEPPVGARLPPPPTPAPSPTETPGWQVGRELRAPPGLEPAQRPAYLEVGSLQPTLRWAAVDSAARVSYDVRVWEQAGATFGLVYSRDGVPGEMHTVDRPLAAGRLHTWAVRARFTLDGGPRVTRWAGPWPGHVGPSGFFFRTPAGRSVAATQAPTPAQGPSVATGGPPAGQGAAGEDRLTTSPAGATRPPAAGSARITLPVRVARQGLIAEALLNGRRVRVLLDGAATRSSITPDVAVSAGLMARWERDGVTTRTFAAGGAPVEIRSLRLGDATLERLRIAVASHRPGIPQDVDAVIGVDLLDFTGMTLDRERGEVSIGVRQ